MKKIYCLFLTVVISLTSYVSAFATDTVGDNAVREDIRNYCIENNIWKNGEFIPDRAVTRGEFAGMIGRALGVADTGTSTGFSDVYSSDVYFKEISALSSLGIITGSGGLYRPNDTITREETAIVIERVYRQIFGRFEINTEYTDTRFFDFEQISSWAIQSVVNVCDSGVMQARVGRTFEPKANTTVMEAAELAYAISKTHNKKYVYSVTEPVGSPETQYDVYQKAIITPQGVTGFGMVARFTGAPGDIYVSRTTTKPKYEHTYGNPADPVTFARVIDPDGNAVARVDLNYIESGKMSKVISIPEGKAGIWQVQIVNGRKDDIVEIGLKNPVSWGVRGEPSFKFTETTPNELYFWVPKKFKQACFGATANFSVKDAVDNLVLSSTSASRTYAKYEVVATTLKTETAYKLVFAEGSNATLAVQGVPKVLSPTKEMAEDLKGNYVYTESGFQMHGPLQARAREAAERLYRKRQGDFSVSINKPDELPEIQNLLGESYLMSAPGIAAVENTLMMQCLDIENPYFGAMAGLDKVSGKTAYQTDTWEVDFYTMHFNGFELCSAIELNAQLNYYYGNQALIDRATLYLLSAVYMCNDLMTMDDTKCVTAGNHYAYTHANFYLEYINAYFYHLKDFIDQEYRTIIQEGIEIMTDKMMNFRGNGPSNQYTHSVSSAMYAYLSTGEERYHTYFKRGIRIVYGVNEGWLGIGQAPAGYCIEQNGCDGQYNQMNVSFMSRFHAEYCSHPWADAETVEIIKNAIDKSLKFESLFSGHRVDGLTTAKARHFTSRTDTDVSNRGGHFGFSYLIDEYPLAKALWDYDTTTAKNYGTIYPWFINSEEHANSIINQVWKDYGHYFDGSTRKAGYLGMYDIFDGRELAEASVLPVYQKDTINEVPGVIGVNHKGLYLASFYNSTLKNGTVGKMCYYGGPSLISSENTAGVVSSMRHKDVKSPDGVVSSCIYGTNPDGSFYVSGKEVLELEWIEDGKKFVTKGIGVGNSRTIAWTYELTDEGIVMTPSIGTISEGQEFWVNIPLTNQSNENFKYMDEAGKLVMECNGASTTLEWDEGLEYKFIKDTKMLRIKFPATGEVSIKLTTLK